MGESKRETEVVICARRPDRQIIPSQENIKRTQILFEAGLRKALPAAE